MRMSQARSVLAAACAVSALVAAAQASAGTSAGRGAADPDLAAQNQWQRWMPTQYYYQAPGEGIAVSGRWWAEYGNPELDELVAIALANNTDLKAAVARIAQAEARARISDAGRSPTLDAIVRAERRAPEYGIGTAPTRADYRSRQIYQAGLRASYEVDLWGKGAYQQASAMAQVKASTFAREALALSLVSDVATRYFEVLSLRERLGLARDDVATAQQIEGAVKRRVERGDLSLFDLEQQGIATSEAAARQYQLEQDLARAENELAYLIGRPRAMLELNGQSLQAVAIPTIAPGLPGALICRRPDVRQAEAELAAARANVGVARKSLMPSFSLTAEGGLGSANLSSALAPQSIFTDIIGQLVQSVFDGGRRRGEIAQGKAVEQELLQRYQSRILGSLRDVEEALSGVRFTGERLAALDSSAARADRMLKLSLRVFDRGAIDYAALLDSQRFQYRMRLQAIEARYDRLRASVDLYKSLGGGMAFKNDPCVKALGVSEPAAPAASAAAAPAVPEPAGSELPAVRPAAAGSASSNAMTSPSAMTSPAVTTSPAATGVQPAKRKSKRW